MIKGRFSTEAEVVAELKKVVPSDAKQYTNELIKNAICRTFYEHTFKVSDERIISEECKQNIISYLKSQFKHIENKIEYIKFKCVTYYGKPVYCATVMFHK